MYFNPLINCITMNSGMDLNSKTLEKGGFIMPFGDEIYMHHFSCWGFVLEFIFI